MEAELIPLEVTRPLMIHDDQVFGHAISVELLANPEHEALSVALVVDPHDDREDPLLVDVQPASHEMWTVLRDAMRERRLLRFAIHDGESYDDIDVTFVEAGKSFPCEADGPTPADFAHLPARWLKYLGERDDDGGSLSWQKELGEL